MGNENHAEEFNKGSVSWNAWRQGQGQDEPPDLSRARLIWKIDVDARSGERVPYDLSGVTISDQAVSVDVSGTNFFSANLKNIEFRHDIRDVDFRRSNLTNVAFTDLSVANSPFNSALARQCSFEAVKFLSCNDTKNETSFENARLIETSFSEAFLKGVSLKRASFVRCDLSEAQYIEFDETYLAESYFASFPTDSWSVLRRHYTGANMLFVLAFSALFFLPMPFEALLLALENRVSLSMAYDVPGGLPLSASEESCLHGADASVDGCYRAAQVLLGWHNNWFVFFSSILLLVFNMFRVLLTWLVAPMRDEELRTGITPRAYPPPARPEGSFITYFLELKNSFRWVYPLHKVQYVLMFVTLPLGMISFTFKLFENIWIG